MNFLNWLKSVWSEPNGNGSSTRVHITALLFFVLGLGTAFGTLAYHSKISIEQFDNFLSTAGTFFVTTSGPLYAVNKLSDFMKTRNP